MVGETSLKVLIESLKPILDSEEYVFCTFPDYSIAQTSQLNPLAVFRETEGLTLILGRVRADSDRLDYDGVYRRIILSVHSSLSAVGLTAAVAAKLTEVNISSNVVAAYFHDHIFVPASDAGKALDALIDLSQQQRGNSHDS